MTSLNVSSIIIISFLLLLLIIASKNRLGDIKEKYIDYSDISSEKYKIYDKVLEEKKKVSDLKKEEIVDSIILGGKKIKDIRPAGDYLPPINYPFYDGAAFYDATPVHNVFTGIPSLYSGGDLKWKPRKFEPFEIANYKPGIARSTSDIPGTANF